MNFVQVGEAIAEICQYLDAPPPALESFTNRIDKTFTVTHHTYKKANESLPARLTASLFVTVAQTVFPTTSRQLNAFFRTYDVYVSYIPFIYKYNFLNRATPDETIVEVEFNLIGFNKNALCLRRATREDRGRFYLLNMTISHECSRIIPFRDNGILVQSVVLEDCPDGCRVSVVDIVTPVPWLSKQCANALERYSLIQLRRLKAILDFVMYDKTTERDVVIQFVAMERVGLEMTLNGRHESVGEVWIDNNVLRLTCVNFVSDKASFIAEGDFSKNCVFTVTRETLLRLIFQDRCSVIDESSQVLHVHKRKALEYTSDNEDITFSAFIYSTTCALVHYQSTDRREDPNTPPSPVTYRFRPSYLFISECNGMWTVRFFLNVRAQTTLPFLDRHQTIHAITRFITNMATTLSPPPPSSPPPLPSSLSFTHTPHKNITLTELSNDVLLHICSYLTNHDLAELARTCTSLHATLRYALLYNKRPLPRPVSPVRPAVITLEDSKRITPTRTTLLGHTNLIRALDIHPSENLIVSGSSDRKIRLWDLKDGSSRVFVGPNSSLVSTRFTTESFIASGYKCGTIRYINWDDSRQSRVFEAREGHIDGFLPLAQMTFLIWNEHISCYEYVEFRQRLLFSYTGHTRKVTVVRPFAGNFASGSADRTVHVWGTAHQQMTILKFKAHKSGVLALEPLDDTHFVTAGNDKAIHFWDVRNVQQPFATIANKVCAMAYAEQKLVCGTEDGRVFIYGPSGDDEHVVLDSTNRSGMCSIAARGRLIAAGFKDGDLTLWRYGC